MVHSVEGKPSAGSYCTNSPTAGAFFHADSVSSPSIAGGVETRVATIVFGDSPPAYNGRWHRRSNNRSGG